MSLMVRIRLQPKQKILRANICKKKFVMYGGAKGGGKSYSIRNILIELCLAHPGLVAVNFRRTYDDLIENHVEKVFEEHPDLARFYNGSKRALIFPNGSRLLFRHCKREEDATRYRGKEYHVIGIDEADEWTEAMFWRIQGSNRCSKPGIPVGMVIGSNPGGIGHPWLKRLFIDKRYHPHEQFNSDDFLFIPALVTDNEALMKNDPDYIRKLESEGSETLRRAYRWGDWTIATGTFFDCLRHDIHVVKAFEIPKHWVRWGAYDFGFGHPASWGWYTADEKGNAYKYRELVKARLDIPEQAELVLKHPESKKLLWEAGHDVFSRKTKLGDSAPTIAQEFTLHGIIMKRANIDRKLGAARLRMYLNHRTIETEEQKGKKVATRVGPKLFLFDSCPVTYDTIGRMVHDPQDIEDVLKVDSEDGDPRSGDDAYDETRYSIMTRPPVTLPLEKPDSKTYRRPSSRGKASSGWTV